MNNTTTTTLSAPWHATPLAAATAKLSWGQIGALSRANATRGAKADAIRETASESYYRALGVS